jgi:hypothetical protein
VSRHLPLRLAHLPKGLQDISGKAQVRLCKRSRPRSARGNHANQVVGAIARDLAACMGAIAQQVRMTPYIPTTYGFVARPKSFAVHRQRRSPGVVSSSTA